MTDPVAETGEARIAVDVPAKGGPTRVELPVLIDGPDEPDQPAEARTAIVLAHGAGSGMRAPFLEGFARAAAAAGVAVLRFEFPYRAAGRKLPGPAAHAVAAWEGVWREASVRFAGARLIAAGKSYGGRMASVAAADGLIDPAGLAYLGYPFHPPGKPERARAEHLPRVAVPQLFVSGERDPFVDPHAAFEEVVDALTDARLAWVEAADHSLATAADRRAKDDGARAAGAAAFARVDRWAATAL